MKIRSIWFLCLYLSLNIFYATSSVKMIIVIHCVKTISNYIFLTLSSTQLSQIWYNLCVLFFWCRARMWIFRLFYFLTKNMIFLKVEKLCNYIWTYYSTKRASVNDTMQWIAGVYFTLGRYFDQFLLPKERSQVLKCTVLTSCKMQYLVCKMQYLDLSFCEKNWSYLYKCKINVLYFLIIGSQL